MVRVMTATTMPAGSQSVDQFPEKNRQQGAWFFKVRRNLGPGRFEVSGEHRGLGHTHDGIDVRLRVNSQRVRENS